MIDELTNLAGQLIKESYKKNDTDKGTEKETSGQNA